LQKSFFFRNFAKSLNETNLKTYNIMMKKLLPALVALIVLLSLPFNLAGQSIVSENRWIPAASIPVVEGVAQTTTEIGTKTVAVSTPSVVEIPMPPRPERPAPTPRKTKPSSVENIELTAIDLRSADMQLQRKARSSSSCEFCAEFVNRHRIFPYSRIPTFMPLPIPETVSVTNTGTETLLNMNVHAWLNDLSWWPSPLANNVEPGETTILALSRPPRDSILLGYNHLDIALLHFYGVAGSFSTDFTGTDDGLYTVDRFGIDVTSGAVPRNNVQGVAIGNLFQITKDAKLNSVRVALGSFESGSLNFTVSIHEVSADLTLGNLLHEQPATFEFPELMRIYWTQVDIPSLNLPEGLYFVSITHEDDDAGLVVHSSENAVTYGIRDGVLQPTILSWAATVRIVMEELVDLWSFSGDTLFINTVGDMLDYGISSSTERPPWQGLSSSTRTLIIGDNVTSIGAHAFRSFGITSVAIPNSVTTIGNGAFAGCNRLTSVAIPNSVTTIGDDAFLNCFGLTSIDLPNSVQHVGSSAFAGTTLVTSLTLPSSIISLGVNPFPTVMNLTVPWNTPISIESTAFPNNRAHAMVLTVPQGTVDTYRATAVWRDFTVITDNPNFEFEGFSGSGTEESPFLISTAEELARLAFFSNRRDTAFSNKHYRLIADIDLSEYGENFNEGRGWIPIGIGLSPLGSFQGVFDGNNHAITGLFINDNTLTRTGLFGFTTGPVKNLRLIDVDIRGGGIVGAITGIAGGPIINCYSSGTVSGTGSAGGIAGSSATTQREEAVIINCHSSCRVSGIGQVGGIIGNAWHDVVNCRFTGVVSGTQQVGGIVGDAFRVHIINSYSTDSVIGTGSFVGGVVGNARGSYITNTYASGVVVGNWNVGGISGMFSDNNRGRNDYGTNNAVLSPEVRGNSQVGRVAGNRASGQFGETFLSGNRALNTLTNISGTTDWEQKTHDALDGADMSATDALTPAFWTTASNWQGSAWDTTFWIFENGKHPTLKNNVFPFQYAKITLSTNHFFHTGTAQKPTITIRFGGTVLTEGVDYTLAITSVDGNETSAGTKTGVVTITATGKGAYVGETFANFLIINPLRGTGTNSDPFLITTAEQLAWMAQRVNSDTTYAKSSYKLMADLDISAYGKGFNNGRGWISIGADMNHALYGINSFRGQFDGNHKTINGLYIQDSSKTSRMLGVGLFGSLVNGTIKNLGVTNINVRGMSPAGLVQLVENSTIINCYTTGEVTAIGARNAFSGFAGGIANQIVLGSAIINSYSTCVVRSNNGDGAGGISCFLGFGSRIINSVALNPSTMSSASGGWGAARVAHANGNDLYLSGNRGLSTMVNIDGNTTWNNKGHDNPNGADITEAEALTASFWTNLANWQGAGWDATVWNFVDGQLPTFQKTATLPIITSNNMPSGNLTTNYNQQLSIIDDEFAVWALKSGRLPDGLDLFHTGLISGRPSKVGTFTFTVGAFNSAGSDTTQLTIAVAGEITPPVITTASLPHGVVGETYSQTLASSGSPAIVWALESGNLPSDVELYSDGTIAGTPSKAGEFTFTALVLNEAGFDTKEFTITVQPGEGTNIHPTDIGPRTAPLQAMVANGKLRVSGLIVGQRWTVYNVLGTRVFQGFATDETVEVNLPIHGTYIIQQNNRTVKTVY
jgi:hypothetical protein